MGKVAAPWRVCLGENGFASGGDAYGTVYPYPRVWEAAARLGFEGVELHGAYHPFPAPEAELRRLRAEVAAAGLGVAGVQTGGPNPCGPEAGNGDRYVEMLRRAVSGAVVLGTGVVGCWPGGRRPELPEAERVARLADAFARVAPLAEQAGVVLAMEPEPVQVADSAEVAMAVVRAVGSPAFALIYDVAHAAVFGGGDPLQSLALMRGHIGHVHFTDADGSCRLLPDGRRGTSTHLAPGEGNVDLGRVLGALRDAGYAGWLQVDVWAHPDPFGAAAAGKRFLEGWPPGAGG